MAVITLQSEKELEKWEQKFIEKVQWGWGALIVAEIQRLIEEIPLWKSGDFWRTVHHYVKDGNLVIEDAVFYGKYLEYGTYAYWQIYGLESFPTVKHPKKMDISAKKRKDFPRGMQPFAPFRRVLYNETLMKELLGKASKGVIAQLA